MSLDKLQSSIPGAVSLFGRSSIPTPQKVTIYNGVPLTRFIYQEDGDPSRMAEVLRLNRIGDPFAELTEGVRLVIPQVKNSFSRHPEA